MTEQYDPYQNAVAERVNRNLKDKFYIGGGFSSYKQARQVIEESIVRPHQSCHFLTLKQMHGQHKVKMVKWKKKTSKARALEVSDKTVILN